MSYVEQLQAATLAERPEQALDHNVRSHLVPSVVCTLVCFAPLGVAAVVCAGNVRTRLALGDIEGARRASRAAKYLCLASLGTTLFFLLVVVLGASSYSHVH